MTPYTKPVEKINIPVDKYLGSKGHLSFIENRIEKIEFFQETIVSLNQQNGKSFNRFRFFWTKVLSNCKLLSKWTTAKK